MGKVLEDVGNCSGVEVVPLEIGRAKSAMLSPGREPYAQLVRQSARQLTVEQAKAVRWDREGHCCDGGMRPNASGADRPGWH